MKLRWLILLIPLAYIAKCEYEDRKFKQEFLTTCETMTRQWQAKPVVAKTLFDGAVSCANAHCIDFLVNTNLEEVQFCVDPPKTKELYQLLSLKSAKYYVYPRTDMKPGCYRMYLGRTEDENCDRRTTEKATGWRYKLDTANYCIALETIDNVSSPYAWMRKTETIATHKSSRIISIDEWVEATINGSRILYRKEFLLQTDSGSGFPPGQRTCPNTFLMKESFYDLMLKLLGVNYVTD